MRIVFAISVCALAGLLTAAQEVQTTCKEFNAEEGGVGKIQCTLRPDIDVQATGFFMRLFKQDQSVDVSKCYGTNQTKKPTCETSESTGFKSASLDNHIFTLSSPNVTADMNGKYELRVICNGTSDPPVHFNFNVLGRHMAITGTEEKNETNHLSWIIPTVLVVVLGLVIMAVFFFKRRKKKSSDNSNPRRQQTRRESGVDSTPLQKVSETVLKFQNLALGTEQEMICKESEV